MKQFGLFFIIFLLSIPVFAQSTNENFPSPVVQNEIAGTITARDVGDARLTRHFYTFYTSVGDLTLKLETANLVGDIDLFEAGTLRPLSKISIYGADSASTTSRIVYFRQRTQVVLRVEGRTPNDEPANYRINLSGSFVAAADLPQPPEDLEPKVAERTGAENVARVNSAGAIIEVPQPKETPAPVKTEAEIPPSETEPARETTAARTARTPRNPPRNPTRRQPRRPATTPNSTAETENTAPAETRTETATPSRRLPRNTPATRRTTRNQPPRPGTETAAAEPRVDPLANVRLVVLLKDGYRIERPMSEILRVSVDKGTLVVIARNGKIERFALLDVQRFSIEQ